MCKMNAVVVSIAQGYVGFIGWITCWGRICMPKILYFHPAVVVPGAKVFFSPSQSYSLLKILILEAVRQLRTFVLVPWEQTKSFGNVSILWTSAGVLLSPNLHRRLDSVFGLKTDQERHIEFCFLHSHVGCHVPLWIFGEILYGLSGKYLHAGRWETGLGYLSSLLFKEIGLWTCKQRYFKGRQLHPQSTHRGITLTSKLLTRQQYQEQSRKRARQWWQPIAEIVIIHKFCQSTGLF